MSFILKNIDKNVIIITNEDLVNPINYTIYEVDDEGSFSPVEGFPADPTNVIIAEGQLQYDLVNDGVYQFIVGQTSPDPNLVYYFVLDYKIRTCKKELTEDLYCKSCKCDVKKSCDKMRTYQKFRSLEDTLYYYWNQWVQTQSVTDLIVPPTDKILYIKNVINLLNSLCKSCGPKNCGCK